MCRINKFNFFFCRTLPLDISCSYLFLNAYRSILLTRIHILINHHMCLCCRMIWLYCLKWQMSKSETISSNAMTKTSSMYVFYVIHVTLRHLSHPPSCPNSTTSSEHTLSYIAPLYYHFHSRTFVVVCTCTQKFYASLPSLTYSTLLGCSVTYRQASVMCSFPLTLINNCRSMLRKLSTIMSEEAGV